MLVSGGQPGDLRQLLPSVADSFIHSFIHSSIHLLFSSRPSICLPCLLSLDVVQLPSIPPTCLPYSLLTPAPTPQRPALLRSR